MRLTDPVTPDPSTATNARRACFGVVPSRAAAECVPRNRASIASAAIVNLFMGDLLRGNGDDVDFRARIGCTRTAGARGDGRDPWTAWMSGPKGCPSVIHIPNVRSAEQRTSRLQDGTATESLRTSSWGGAGR